MRCREINRRLFNNMKRVLLLALLIVATCIKMGVAQTIKTYSGELSYPNEAFYPDEKRNIRLGNGSYQYYEKDGKRVKHGFFKFISDTYICEGQFSHGRKNGTWTCMKMLHGNYNGSLITGVVEEWEVAFQDDLPNGPYQYRSNSFDIARHVMSATTRNGKLSGKFTVTYSASATFYTPSKERKSDCPIDVQGRANGIWTIQDISNGRERIAKLEFCHGMHILTSIYDDSTGEDIISYKHEKYDTYKQLSLYGHDTLVLDKPYIVKRDTLYSIAGKADYSQIKWLDDVYASTTIFDNIFCKWEIYKTIAEVCAEEKRRVEEQLRQEEAARQAALQAAEEKRKRVINAPFLQQVKRNDCMIDSMYRKKRDPFFVAASKYEKPTILRKYKSFCRELDSLDTSSIKDVLYLQDIVMKLRYMKTKKVEQQLKKGNYYTTESVRCFFRNEALNLAE